MRRMMTVVVVSVVAALCVGACATAANGNGGGATGGGSGDTATTGNAQGDVVTGDATGGGTGQTGDASADAPAQSDASVACVTAADCAGKLTLAPCQIAACTNGTCQLAPAADGVACDDASLCTDTDKCKAGTCKGTAKTCKDDDSCTVDACEAATGKCTFAAAADGAKCDDGNLCLTGDTCKAGVCKTGTTALSCDDKDDCTKDSCDAKTGCRNEAIPGCGGTSSSACKPSDQPGTADKTVEACVCGLDAYCCNVSWDSTCVGEAKDDCGADCGCEKLPKAELACTSNSDCAFCDSDFDLCDGGWSCVAGTCTATAAVECDTSKDKGCVKTACEPGTGKCSTAASDAGCSDKDACTVDTCDTTTGECTNVKSPECGTNSPCKTSTFPSSADPDVTACVCAMDSYCCNSSWDSICVNEAKSQCNAQCQCDKLTADKLACTKTADCTWCDENANVCDGGWQCDSGTCTPSAAVTCDGSGDKGCVKNTCNPTTAVCEVVGSSAQCDDKVQCTSDSCDAKTGECAHSWPTCTKDTDCSWCAGGNFCNGLPICVDGHCQLTPPITCGEGGSGCVLLHCEPQSGKCVTGPVDTACADEDPCTRDRCDAVSGSCKNDPLPGCHTNHPCQATTTPGTSESSIDECVCALNPSCCTDAWTWSCPTTAQKSCSVKCFGCNTLETPLACTTNADCGVCNNDTNLCNGGWVCDNGACVEKKSVTCPTAPTTPGSCYTTQCNPETGACENAPADWMCSTKSGSCTTSKCSAEGLCVDEPIPNCGTQSPCVTSQGPGSSDAAVTSCVCAKDPYCCNNKWDGLCAGAAPGCGAVCDCSKAEASCTTEADCAFCGAETPCAGGWACTSGTCTATGPVVCDPGLSTGCAVGKCVDPYGICVAYPAPKACDDGNKCTTDQCSLTTGECSNASIDGCVP